FRERVECSNIVLARTRQSVDFTLWLGKCAVLSWVGEICDRRLSAYQDQLTELLELLDSLFEDVLNTVDPWNPRAPLQTGNGIRSQQSRSCRCSDSPRGS